MNKFNLEEVLKNASKMGGDIDQTKECMIVIGGDKDNNGLYFKGSSDNLTNTILECMQQKPEFKSVVLDAAIKYTKESEIK